MSKVDISPKYSDVKPQGYYVYLHRRTTDGSVFYVGKGKGRRGFKYQSRNKWWRGVASKHGVTVEIYRDKMIECCAYTLEKLVIFSLREMNANIVNMTDGGDGASFPGESNPFYGKTHTMESRRKIVENRTELSGPDHPNWDANIYHLFHSEYGDVTGTRRELMSATNLSYSDITSLINRYKVFRGGWSLFERRHEASGYDRIRGELNKSFDHTVRLFTHNEHGEFVGTSKGLTDKFNLDRSEVTKITKGKRKSHKGWKYVSCRIRMDGREML